MTALVSCLAIVAVVVTSAFTTGLAFAIVTVAALLAIVAATIVETWQTWKDEDDCT